THTKQAKSRSHFCRNQAVGYDFLREPELKAIISLEDVHLAQAKNYVVAYDMHIGLLINFGATSLQFKKTFTKYNPHPGNPTIV
ncbi:MAG: GxxExxY protein, partial [Saprospiraceae bacterium]|nr:GxxExxY protein [Saprospiraceae bacterium]